MKPLTVLTSGVGLGSYVAALLHQARLRHDEHEVDTEVIEGWFTEAHLARHLAHRDAYRENFRLALAGRELARGVDACLDGDRVDALLAGWEAQSRTRFCVWSGYWLPVLERYSSRLPDAQVELDLCRIDAIPSDSFRFHPRPAGAVCRELWLWNWERRSLGTRLPVPAGRPLRFGEREPRLVVHGGGWGLGTYREVLGELSAAGYALDVMAPVPPEWNGRTPQDRRYTADPQWQPWVRDAAGELSFPPLGAVDADGAVQFETHSAFPPAHLRVHRAQAVVSKPGGGTLLDSLAAATPVVLLAPWGTPEARNGALWQELGFGVDLERWRATGFSAEVLEELHENLMRAQPHPAEALVSTGAAP